MLQSAPKRIVGVSNTLNALEVRTAITLASVYVLRMMGLFMVMPVLAVAAMDYPDYSPMLVGIAIGGYGLTQAALQIPMGMLSDKWGRKPVIIMGLAVFALGSLIAASADSLVLMVVGRIMQGAGAIAGAIMALATDVSRESQRAKVMAIIGIAIGFSFYLAVIIGPLIAQQWGMPGIFFMTGLLALACMPLIKWVVPEVPKSVGSADTLPQANQVWRLFTSPQLWRLNLSVMFLHLMITLLFVQLPVTLTHFNLTLDNHWEVYLPVLLCSVLLLVLIMGKTRGTTPRAMVILAIVLMGVCFAVLSAGVTNWWLMMAAVVLFFTGFNFLEASFPALVSSIAPAGEKGTAMGIYASFQFFGAFLGGVISGALGEVLSASGAYAAGVVLALVWLVFAFGLKSREKLRRVVMQTHVSHDNMPALVTSMQAVSGVVECTAAPESGTLYMKVNADFDEYQAQHCIEQVS